MRTPRNIPFGSIEQSRHNRYADADHANQSWFSGSRTSPSWQGRALRLPVDGWCAPGVVLVGARVFEK